MCETTVGERSGQRNKRVLVSRVSDDLALLERRAVCGQGLDPMQRQNRLETIRS